MEERKPLLVFHLLTCSQLGRRSDRLPETGGTQLREAEVSCRVREPKWPCRGGEEESWKIGSLNGSSCASFIYAVVNLTRNFPPARLIIIQTFFSRVSLLRERKPLSGAKTAARAFLRERTFQFQTCADLCSFSRLSGRLAGHSDSPPVTTVRDQG